MKKFKLMKLIAGTLAIVSILATPVLASTLTNTADYVKFVTEAKKMTTTVDSNGLSVFKDGTIQYGWQVVADSEGKTTWYYCDPSTGYSKTGWLSDNGYWYYLRPEKNGAMFTFGWLKYNDNWYYFGYKEGPTGSMNTGWIRSINGNTDEHPFGWYCMDGEGKLITNTTVDSYRVGENGKWLDDPVEKSAQMKLIQEGYHQDASGQWVK